MPVTVWRSGVPYSPHIDATAIALLALAGHEKEPGVQSSLAWLVKRLPGCPSPYSLAWGILALAAYRGVNREVETTLERTTNELVALVESEVARLYQRNRKRRTLTAPAAQTTLKGGSSP